MIELKAILVESGRAFIADKGRYFHAAPPYTMDAVSEVQLHDIEDATSGYGFVIAEGKFNDYAALKNHLVKEYNQWKADNNAPDRTMTDADRMRKMPPAMFRNFLENLNRNFDAGQYEQIYRMGQDMLENTHQAELKDEFKRLETLLNKCNEMLMQTKYAMFVSAGKKREYLQPVFKNSQRSMRLQVENIAA